MLFEQNGFAINSIGKIPDINDMIHIQPNKNNLNINIDIGDTFIDNIGIILHKNQYIEN